MLSDLKERYTHTVQSTNIKPAARRLFVSIEQQICWVCTGEDGFSKRYSVSTGIKPPSNREGSGGTPRGLHRIESKIGSNAPIGAVFKGRVDIGKTFSQLGAEERKPNLITTRILWLHGLEPGYNQGPGRDSHQRYIYFHGTNHEDKIGQPSSGGCIQLLNTEMRELFDSTEVGDHVFIG